MGDARGRGRPHDTVVDEPYPGIDSYALIADCHSAALVSRAGSVDWACLRRFDAGSAFGRLLDWELGGHFSLTPRALRDVSRRYIDETMVLETTFVTASGSVRVLDAFNIGPGPDEPVHQLIRIVEGVDGLWCHRRDRRGADDVVARGDRRRPQLGLSLLMGA